MMQVSLSLLEEIGACEDAREWFYKGFGLRSVRVVDALDKCEEDMWVVWFAAAMEHKLYQSGCFQSMAINMIAELVEEKYPSVKVALADGSNNVNVLHELDEAVSELSPALFAYSVAQSIDFLLDVRPSDDEDAPPSGMYATSIYNALTHLHGFVDASKIMFDFAVKWLMGDEQ